MPAFAGFNAVKSDLLNGWGGPGEPVQRSILAGDAA
jgi:hypothetical protein